MRSKHSVNTAQGNTSETLRHSKETSKLNHKTEQRLKINREIQVYKILSNCPT